MSTKPAEVAAQGRALLQEAVLAILAQGPLSNAEIAQALDLRSDHGGNDKDYLTWMILGDLLRTGRIVKRKVEVGGKRKRTEFVLV